MSGRQFVTFLKKNTMILILLAVLVFFTLMTDGNMLSAMSVTSLISQNAYVFILATGMLLCILTGGNIDLSVGSIVCFAGAIGGILLVKLQLPLIVAIIGILAVGILIGAFQGFWIAYVRIPPFIVTLAGMLAFRGLSNAVLGGKSIPVDDKYSTFLMLFGGGNECYVTDVFSFIGIEKFNVTCFALGILATAVFILTGLVSRNTKIKKGYEVENFVSFVIKEVFISIAILAITFRLSQYKGFPMVLIWVMIVVLIYGYITSNTTVGRYFYAVGGNEKATKLSGINTNKVYFLAYANMGLLAAVSSLVVVARLGSAQTTAGDSYEMDAIASCFIGGASAYGGIGTVPGVIIGATLIGVINMGMSLMNVDADYQKVVRGAVLLAAVIFDVVSKRGGKFIAKN